MFKKILIALAAVVAVFLLYVARKPSEFKITRSASIAAPAKVVFPQVNDFHKWEPWSPWAKKDPQAKNSFEGAAAGKGAKFSWAGNKEVGEGSMTITESRPNELVLIDLNFVKPFKASNVTEFTFKPEGKGTAVTWTMSGKQPFFGKIMCTFMDMDKMVGADFEKGLAGIKAISEAAAAPKKK